MLLPKGHGTHVAGIIAGFDPDNVSFAMCNSLPITNYRIHAEF